MKFVLVLFAVGAGVAAGYLASDRGASDATTLVVGGAALFGIVLYVIIPEESQPDRISLRPRNPRAPREYETGRAPAVVVSEAERDAAREAVFSSRSAVSAILVDTGRNQIGVIKVLRNYLDIGLKDAKDLSDAAKRGGRPVLARELPVERAREIARDIEHAGGQVEFE